MMTDKEMVLPQLAVPAERLVALLSLEEQLLAKQTEINQWFAQQWQQYTPPLYGSVDLRNAGFKLAPVDMNLFPAGFNNLNPHFFEKMRIAASETILQLVPEAKTLALVPENYTRNLFYWENIAALVALLTKAGFTVRLASLDESQTAPLIQTLQNGETLLIEPLRQEHGKAIVGDKIPDMLLLNNDLSAGIPPLLQNIQQPIFPPAALGWHQRLKSAHFDYYAHVSQEFAALLEIDPWLITPLFRRCEDVNFLTREGLDCLIKHTAALLADTQKKYQQYGVTQAPFAVIKADAGTQGMAVMMVRDSAELTTLNRKQRISMSKSKSGVPVSQVIVQEGIYTAETFGREGFVAEPVVYLWGQRVVGGFYRIHQQRGIDENLNSPGMQFDSFPFAWDCAACPQTQAGHPYQRHLYAYGVIAQLSMLAAAQEMKKLSGTQQ